MSEIEKAIKRLESCSIIPFDEDSQEVCGLAIQALHEKQARGKRCEYCDFSSGDVGGTLPGPDNFQLIRSEDGIWLVSDGYGHFRSVKINCCPMCGRDLKKE